jgi:hypothetical protein
LLVGAQLFDRLESLKVSGSGLELTLSREIADLGAPKTAAVLETAGLTSYMDSYEFVHKELAEERYEGARIKSQDALVGRAASIARTQKLDVREVRRMFAEGQPLLRVLALGLMEGDLSLADGATILDAISDSRTANEQYHGLKLAELCWQGLTGSQRSDPRRGAGRPENGCRRHGWSASHGPSARAARRESVAAPSQSRRWWLVDPGSRMTARGRRRSEARGVVPAFIWRVRPALEGARRHRRASALRSARSAARRG